MSNSARLAEVSNISEATSVISSPHLCEELMSFMVDGEFYAVDVKKIQEIRVWEEVTPIPNSESYVMGVLNLRGDIVPVIDLKGYFGLGAIVCEPTTVMIILTISDGESDRVAGIVTEQVSEVIAVNGEALSDVPKFGDRVNTESVVGLLNHNESQMVMVLDCDRLVTAAIPHEKVE